MGGWVQRGLATMLLLTFLQGRGEERYVLDECVGVWGGGWVEVEGWVDSFLEYNLHSATSAATLSCTPGLPEAYLHLFSRPTFIQSNTSQCRRQLNHRLLTSITPHPTSLCP